MLTLNVLTETKCMIFSFPSRMRVLLFTSAQCLSVQICQTTWESVDCFWWGFLKIVSKSWPWMKVPEGWTVLTFCTFSLCATDLVWVRHIHFTSSSSHSSIHLDWVQFWIYNEKNKKKKKKGEKTNFLFLTVNFCHCSKMVKWLDLAHPILQTFRLNTSLAASSLR